MLCGIWRMCTTVVFVLLTVGLTLSAWAQDPIIMFGETIEGTLTTTDRTFPNGAYFDQYTFESQARQSYTIKVKSDSFAAWGMLMFGSETPLQAAYVFQPGYQVQFSGTLEHSGQHKIVVSNAFGEPTLGPYSLTLFESNNVPSDCIGGSSESPVMISAGQTLQCMITNQDEPFTDQQSNTYFGKYFTYQSNGQPFTITARSNEFPTFIGIFDPTTGTVILSGQQILNVDQAPQDPVTFAVIANQPNVVGQFTVTISSSPPSTTELTAPTLISPTDGAVCWTTLVFKWSEVPGATIYRIHVTDAEYHLGVAQLDARGLCENGVCFTGTSQFVSTDFPEGLTFWQVVACDDTHCGPLSELAVFTLSRRFC